MADITFLSSIHCDSICKEDPWLISPALSSTHCDSICEKDSMNSNATALISYDGQGPNTEVLSIMKRVVSLTSKNKNKADNVNFLLWIYDGNNIVKDLSLEEWFRKKLSDAKVRD